jgi:Fe-S-cluster-containing dehydrogenase component
MSQYAFLSMFLSVQVAWPVLLACQDQNDFAADDKVAFRHVTKYEEGSIPRQKYFIFLSPASTAEMPLVLWFVPQEAYLRNQEDGSVVVNQDLCVGCHSCELACPFGAPQFPESGKNGQMRPLLCSQRIRLKPACARACPAHALEVGQL